MAIDQAYHRRQKDREGEFFRKIAAQSPRNDFSRTTQGLFTAGPDGKLLGFTNNRSPERVRRMLLTARARAVGDAVPIEGGKVDSRFNPRPPEGGLVVRVNAQVLGGYQAAESQSERIFQSAISRDNLWVSKREHAALAKGGVPQTLQHRIARFHLVDNTRGEPPMWKEAELNVCRMSLQGTTLTGRVELRSADGRREFKCDLLGDVEVAGGKVTRFDIVAKGKFRGEGRYTRGAPKGEFPLGIAFRLADMKDIADRIPPQGSRGWVDGYMKPE